MLAFRVELLIAPVGGGWFIRSIIMADTTAIFLSSKGDLVQHELGDWVREGGGYWEVVRLGLEAIGVSHEVKAVFLTGGEGEPVVSNNTRKTNQFTFKWFLSSLKYFIDLS